MSYLKHFGVGNFKVFKELTQFELAPITILTGKNNSGKSSLIKSMLLFKNGQTEKSNLFEGFQFEQWKIDRSELKLGSSKEIFNFDEKCGIITFEFSTNSIMLPNGIISLEYSFESSDETFNLVAFKILSNNESIIEFVPNFLLYDPSEHELTQFIKIDFLYFLKRLKEILPNSKEVDMFKLGEKIGLHKRFGNKSEGPMKLLLELLESDLVILGFDNPEVLTENDFVGGGKIDISREDLIKVQNRLFEIYKEGFLTDQSVSWDSCIRSFNVDLHLNDKIREIFNQDGILVKKIGKACSHRYKDAKFERALYLEPKLHSFFRYINTFVQNTFYELDQEFKNITYLPSIRARNERLYQVSKEGYAIQEIDQDAFEKIDFENKIMRTYYLEALRDFEIGESIVFKTYQRTATEISIIRNGRSLLLSDLGFGYAQLVPIILNILITAQKWGLWRYKEKEDITFLQCPKILIEEPESNLHPDFQSKLADLFIKATNLFGIQFIIETHSEYLIRRLQYLTAKKEIKPKDISIYYFNSPLRIPIGEKQIAKIEIRSDGILKQDFGSGFYDQAANSTFDLFRQISDN